MDIKELRRRSQEIRSQYEGKYHVKWSSEFKQAVVKALHSGEDLKKICEETGIARQTIMNWQPPKKPPKLKKFKEVRVTPLERENILTLNWSGGLEVSGLSFSQLCELLSRGLL